MSVRTSRSRGARAFSLLVCIAGLVLAVSACASHPATMPPGPPSNDKAPTMNDDMPSPSRPSPPAVAPIVHNGVRYEQDMQSYRHGGTQSGGYLVAIDQATGERLWMLKVYEVPSQDAAGVSTPGRYFKSMRLLPDGGRIEIESEVGGKYVVDVQKRTSTWMSGPDSVHKARDAE